MGLALVVCWFCFVVVVCCPCSGTCYRILAGGILLHVSSPGSLFLLFCFWLRPAWNRSSFFTGCPWNLYSLTFSHFHCLSLVTWLKALGASRKKKRTSNHTRRRLTLPEQKLICCVGAMQKGFVACPCIIPKNPLGKNYRPVQSVQQPRDFKRMRLKTHCHHKYNYWFRPFLLIFLLRISWIMRKTKSVEPSGTLRKKESCEKQKVKTGQGPPETQIPSGKTGTVVPCNSFKCSCWQRFYFNG